MRQVLYPRLNKRQVEACARLNDDLAVAGETIQRWNNASTTPLLRILAQVQELLCELYNASEAAVEHYKQVNEAKATKRKVG